MPREAYNSEDWYPEKVQEYRMFLFWLALPAIFKTGKLSDVEKLGLDVPEFDELFGIKTRTQFAEKYNVDPGTLTEWSKAPIPPEFADINYETLWAKPLIKNVNLAFYRQTLKHGDAARVKLYNQMFGGFVEKSEVDDPHSRDVFNKMDEVLNTLKDESNGDTNDTDGTIGTVDPAIHPEAT